MRRNLRAANQAIDVTERQLRQSNLTTDNLNWYIEGTYHPTPPFLNPVPYHTIVSNVESNFITLRHSLASRIARSQFHHPLHYLYRSNCSVIGKWDPVHCSRQQDHIELFREYNHFLDIVENTPLDLSEHL